MSGTEEDRRKGRRAASTERMLDAAEELFAQYGFDGVSVRDIAEVAGVSHALVHRYLGNKEEIYRAVLKRNEDVILAAAGDNPDLIDSVRMMYREGLTHHQRYLRLVAQSALQGIPFESSIVRFSATERLVRLARHQVEAAGPQRRESLDPRLVIAAVVSLYLGWAATGAWLVKATGLDDMDGESIRAGLEHAIVSMIQATLPSLDDEAAG